MNYIKQVVAWLLVGSSLVSAFIAPLVYLDFELRRDYIAEVLCINKDKPITVCGGECFLNKQLKLFEGDAQDQKAPVQEELRIAFFFQEFKQITLFNRNYLLLNGWDASLNQDKLLVGFNFDIFHPPRV
ncbi:MAG: hypothetical protein COW03_05805 [Cytophagales bacterium CG12_big_fil_rev_8_21_14_0_65_40_12]|nr:MAG: hypothetical protein COW03_05805 [Cytophagales bacterium CG12_big_fil_rev_8_21_14_0_65_40_12]PIW04419.1 MAG: hypothetical protein COW40_09900 [Cytophagales bacterium CG17_big_fil_post_rev_8_21_14_2_50_40_13]